MSVSQRKDGRWLVKYKSSNGAWVQRAFRTADEARAFDSDQAATGHDSGRLTIGELVACYLRSNPDKYHETRRRIVWLFADGGPCAFMRDKYADILNRQDLEHVRENMRLRNASNRTINCYHAYIRAILAWGVDQDFLKFNPWRDYKHLSAKKRIVSAEINDFRRVYQNLPDYMQWAAKTAFFLALRPGMVELFGLLWTSFQWQRGIVIVCQGKGGRLKTVIPHPAYMDEARERFARDMASGIPLVCHRNGNRVLSYRTVWETACRRAGVMMRFYDIRHCAATSMLAAGADLAAVAAQMGHASVTTTGNTYAHVTPAGQALAGSIMPALEAETKKEK